MAENTRSGSRRDRRKESISHNSIACEPCRTKKRRCDRRLPVCLQCSHDPSSCQYPEQNKRGLPSGYVNKLEARLAETEAALIFLLNQRPPGEVPYTLTEPLPMVPTPGQNKTEHLKDWERFPFRSISDVESWYRSKVTATNDGHNPSPAMTTSSSHSHAQHVATTTATMPAPGPGPGPGTLWGTETAHMVHDAQHPPTWPTPSAPSAPTAPVASVTSAAPSEALASGTPDRDSSRAKLLSQAQNNLYF